jgi:AcrR family transcriptional regulator
MHSVHNSDGFNNKTVRIKPSQQRGKERVRTILGTALELFRERGMERVTTNDIAKRANIPIGSLYRYYPNKESIIDAIIAMYVEDLSTVFKEIAHQPTVPNLSWEEVMTALLDGWVGYSRRNGSFSFLFGVWANPELYQRAYKNQQKFMTAFAGVLRKRHSQLKKRHILVCFNLSLVAVKMAMNEEDQRAGGPGLLQETVVAIAVYMDNVCRSHTRSADDILV